MWDPWPRSLWVIVVTLTSSHGLSSQSFPCAVGSVYLQKCIYTTACHRWIISKHSKTVTLLKQTPDRLSRPASAFTFQFAHQSLWLSFEALRSISVSGKEEKKKKKKKKSWAKNKRWAQSLQSSSTNTSSSRPVFALSAVIGALQHCGVGLLSNSTSPVVVVLETTKIVCQV